MIKLSSLTKRLLTSVSSVLTVGTLLAVPVKAADDTSFGICKLLGPIGQPFGCASGNFGDVQVARDYILPRLQFVLSLLFIGLILFAIIYVVRAAITYIQSQGQPDKIAEATKAIRAVFVGLGALFVGIAGILLILAFFGGSLAGNDAGGTQVDIQCVDRPQCCVNGKFDTTKCTP